MTPDQERHEREIILAMLMMLRDLRDAGYSDFQSLTSFLANLCMDQPDPMEMLRSISENTKLKIRTPISLTTNRRGSTSACWKAHSDYQGLMTWPTASQLASMIYSGAAIARDG